jgi:hypothetical protein
MDMGAENGRTPGSITIILARDIYCTVNAKGINLLGFKKKKKVLRCLLKKYGLENKSILGTVFDTYCIYRLICIMHQRYNTLEETTVPTLLWNCKNPRR